MGAGKPSCQDASDSNDDGKIDIADPIATLTTLFLAGGRLPEPNGTPGLDPTPDALTCHRR
jgi:hypothetical protein